MTSRQGVEKMEKFKVGDKVLVEAVIDDAYPIPDKTYEDGLNDAWKMANRIAEMETSDVEEIFGDYYTIDEIMENFTAVETAVKIKAWGDKSASNEYTRNLIRTGRTIDIEKVLKQIGESE